MTERIPGHRLYARERYETVLRLFEADPSRRWTVEEILLCVRREYTGAEVTSTIAALRTKGLIDLVERGSRLRPSLWMLAPPETVE